MPTGDIVNAVPGRPALRLGAATVTVAILAGCKVTLIPGQGGSIEGNNGTSCPEGEVCHLVVETADFLEEFRATPEPGWRFLHWQARSAGLCGGSTADTCRLDTTNFAAFPALLAILQSDARFFLEAVFEPSAPIVEVWGRDFVIAYDTAFCGIRGTGVPVEGGQYTARLTMYDDGRLGMQYLGGGFLGIEDPLRLSEHFWTPTDEGEYLHRFRWEWNFEGEWRFAQVEVTWQLDPGATTLTTRQFSAVLSYPDIFDAGTSPGFQCKFTTRATGTLADDSE